jgi:hypothetical protein
VISTRTYQDRLDTLDRVRDAGINVLRGIIGMGESRASARADFAAREPNPYPDSVPINNLVAIEGTPLEGTAPLDPFEFAHDRGRAHHDAEGRRAPVGRPRAARRRLQALFLAGANSMFYGDQLLTTSNRNRRRSRVVRAARHARERRGRDVRRRVSVSALARRARSGGRICAAWRAPTRRGGRSAISRACLNEARQRRRRERQNPMLRKTWGSSAFRAGTSAGFFRNAGATPAPASPCAAAPSSAARTRATCSASTGASTSPRGRTPEPKCTACTPVARTKSPTASTVSLEPASTVHVVPAACRTSRVIVATASSTDGWPPEVSTDVTAGTRSSASNAAFRSRATSKARGTCARPSAAAAIRASASTSTSPCASSAPNTTPCAPAATAAHVALDHAQVVGVVDERALWAHDHVDRNRHRGDDGLDQADARREPAFADRGHELEAVGAARWPASPGRSSR